MSALPRLLLDRGNTRLKWALVAPGETLGAVQAEAHHDHPAERLLALEWPAVSAVWLSAVPRLADPAAWTAAVQARCGVTPDKVCFLSSNCWDAHGAAHFGFRTVWVNRAGAADDNLPGAPVAQLRDLSQLPSLLGVS